MAKMTLSEELQWRGFIQQTTVTDLSELDTAPQTFYHGFDASADSQAIGNLAAMMFDKVFMRHGWKAILLAGGATSLIGDPGGKDKERNAQAETVIQNNVKKAEQQLKKIFGDNAVTLVNNLDWTKEVKVLDFLRDVGKFYSMTPLIQRDYIASRLGDGGSGISFSEFSYTLLQGMDFLYLFDNYGVTMQLGGSDQWGNCLSGVDLIRKKRGKEVNVMTLPLVINQATGRKFGKSEEGAVWLDKTKTSVYKFYQFWINIDDAGAETYLKVYTELNKEKIDQLIAEHSETPQLRLAQKALAYEVTSIVHSKDVAEQIKRISESLFGDSGYHDLSVEDFKVIQSELPGVKIADGADLIGVLVDSGLASSKGEARRLISQGSIRGNDDIAYSEDNQNLSKDTSINGFIILWKGKKYPAVVEIQ